MNAPAADGPFHDGELRAQALAGGGATHAFIRAAMPEQHREFFALLRAIFVAVPDADGAPIATVLTGAPGFVTSPDPTTLHIAARVPDDDPAAAHAKAHVPIGLLGLQFETRRRNRANGRIAQVDATGLTVSVRQSFGNCPKYIQTRIAHPLAAARTPAESVVRLDDEAEWAIAQADTFFVATRSAGLDGARDGMDMSHRGGRPGFVRIEGDTLVVPDYMGNRYFNTLGNLQVDARAGLLFVDFERGDLLHLHGRATIDWRAPAGASPVVERSWRFEIEGGVRRRRALDVGWTFDAWSPALPSD